MTDSRDLFTALLREARWFGGKGRPFSVATVRRLAVLRGTEPWPAVAVDLVEVAYADGLEPSVEHYQVPLACYPEAQDRLGHAQVGQELLDDPDLGPVHRYDAVHDRDAMAVWLTAFAAGGERDGLTFHRATDHELDLETHSTLFSGEQSNSTVMFGEDSLLKLFRKVTPGVNPDIAVHEVLTRAGSTHVAHLFGWVEAPSPADLGGQVLQLGMLQQFLRTASDGWELALASVRNLYSEADLHAEEVGGDFAAESARLGEALREVHETLAEHFPTAERGPEDLHGLAATMVERLEQALDVVPGLAEHTEALRAAYDDLAHHPGDTAQQIHGDLHLGQTLRTVGGWKIVDFEGEPAKPLAERSAPDSPWRDVAGMLRSFDYAAAVVAMTAAETDPEGAEQRAYRGTEWTTRNRGAFLGAYAGRELTDAEQAMLTAYVADKAVYEAVYEARNRPGWVSIPLTALARLRPGPPGRS